MLDELGARGLIPLSPKSTNRRRSSLLSGGGKEEEGEVRRKRQISLKDGDQKGEHRISPLILYALHSVNMSLRKKQIRQLENVFLQF